MAEAGVPIVPGTTEPVATVEEASKLIKKTIGYPVAVKAAGGGGGKGFRVAESEDKLQEAFEGAAREGEKFFSDPTVYLERYLPDPRHVEVQVLADTHGNVIHLGERDCSLQRRHQKLIEEAPAPAVDEELRARIGKIATEAAAAVGYTGAGTIEGLLQEGRVLLPRDEHARAGRALRDRDGHRDRHRQGGDPRRRGRAAVDLTGGCGATRTRDRVPDQRRGRVEELRAGARQDQPLSRAGRAGRPCRFGRRPRVGDHADVRPDGRQADRVGCRPRAGDGAHGRALREYEIGGLKTLLPFHEAILQTRQWHDAETCRDLIEDRKWLKSLAFEAPAAPSEEEEPEAPALEQSYTVEVSGKRFDVRVIGPPFEGAGVNGAGPAAVPAARKPPRRSSERAAGGGGGTGGDTLSSPLQGTVLKVAVEQGATVQEGALIAVIEAMKMENEITAHKSGTVAELPIAVGSSVATGDTLAVISGE